MPGVIECVSYGLHFCCNGKLPYQYSLHFFLAFTSHFRVSTVKALTLKARHKCLRYLPPWSCDWIGMLSVGIIVIFREEQCGYFFILYQMIALGHFLCLFSCLLILLLWSHPFYRAIFFFFLQVKVDWANQHFWTHCF